MDVKKNKEMTLALAGFWLIESKMSIIIIFFSSSVFLCVIS